MLAIGRLVTKIFEKRPTRGRISEHVSKGEKTIQRTVARNLRSRWPSSNDFFDLHYTLPCD